MNLQALNDPTHLDRAPTSTPRSPLEALTRRSIILISGALSISGTSSAEPHRLWGTPYLHEPAPTTSGERRAEPTSPRREQTREQTSEATREAITELRRRSGLTWEQLGELFGVSRRSVHFWASGKPLNAENEARVLNALEIIQRADRGDARSTRAALMEVHQDRSLFDLIGAQRFDEARARLTLPPIVPRPTLGELSAQAKAARAPLPPEERVDALQDRAHLDLGHARAARTVRSARHGAS